MADVNKFDPMNADTKVLKNQAMRAFRIEDYNLAVQAYSRLTELLVAEHDGDDLHDSLGDIYLYYGKSLLGLSRKEGEPLGMAVLKTVNEEEAGESDDSEVEGNEVVEAEDADKKDFVETPTDKVLEIADTKKTETDPLPSEETKKIESSIDSSKPGTSSNEDIDVKEATENDDELTDLQVGWEVLELAKKIFEKRGDLGRKDLADTLIALGEISMENENFESAIEDIKQGLEIQLGIFDKESRALAETHYKLGMAYAVNSQVDEAVEHFTSSLTNLRNRMDLLKKSNNDEHKEEIEEISQLIDCEIKEKIIDMKNYKTEVIEKLKATVAQVGGVAILNGKSEATNGTGSSSSSSQATDISHLVKRKRRSDDANDDKDTVENPTKKISP